MRRMILVVMMIGGASFVLSTLSIRPVQHNVAVAEASWAASDEVDRPTTNKAQGNVSTGIAHALRESHDDSLADFRSDLRRLPPYSASSRTASFSSNAIPDQESVQIPAQSARLNRFDRGRLAEEFDGEQYQSLGSKSSATAATPDAPAIQNVTNDDPHQPVQLALQELGVADTDIAPAIPKSRTNQTPTAPPTEFGRSKLIPVPSRPKMPTAYSPPKDDFGAPPSFTPQVSRVTLKISPDRQMRIVAERSTHPTELPKDADGSLLITAEEIALVPSMEPGVGNQLTCTGHVQLTCSKFTAECTRLSLVGEHLTLEGGVKQKAVVIKQAAEDESEFQLSAEKISFTLSLDKIQIGNGVTISPSAASSSDARTQPRSNSTKSVRKLESIEEELAAPVVPPKTPELEVPTPPSDSELPEAEPAKKKLPPSPAELESGLDAPEAAPTLPPKP